MKICVGIKVKGSGFQMLACVTVTERAWPVPKISNPEDLGWGQRICVSNKFPGDTSG